MGIGKSTLHYLRRNASGEGSFRVYQKVRKKLERNTEDASVS
jgi:hypothetical protein